jgi:fibronectin type 3 domain-containing protein
MHILSGKKNSKIRLFPALAIMPLFLLFCYQVPVSVNQPLDAPTGVTAIAVSESSINVSWNDIAQDVEGFIVERSASGGTAAAADWTAVNDADTNIYNDANLSPQTNYYYRVMAYSGNIKSNYSAIGSATTLPAGTLIPNTPTGLTVTSFTTSTISLSWTDNSGNETGYRVYRAENVNGNPGSWTLITQTALPVNTVTYIDNNSLDDAATYFYRVRAFNDHGESDVSNVVSGTTLLDKPAAPTNLDVTAVTSKTISLVWRDNSDNETGFRIYRANDVNGSPGTWSATPISLSADTISYTDNGLSSGTKYHYLVKAYNSAGESIDATVSGTTSAASASTQIIADHTVVAQYDRIPQVWINEVKKMWVSYAGESHSSGIRKGAILLETLNSKFAVSVIESGTPQAYTTENLRLSRATRGDVSTSNAWVYSYGEEDWFTSATAISQTKSGLDYCYVTGPSLAVLAFGWCWDHDVYINSTSINAYLSATQQYIDYCTTKGYSTKVIFTTGPVDGYTGLDAYNRYISSEQIRTYVTADSSRILFDYADILAWSNGGEENTSTYNGNIYNLIHSSNMLDYNADWTTTLHSEDGDHIGEVGALRLAKAMWWVLARIAGWDGVSTD